jgi:hypothetical protein
MRTEFGREVNLLFSDLGGKVFFLKNHAIAGFLKIRGFVNKDQTMNTANSGNPRGIHTRAV